MSDIAMKMALNMLKAAGFEPAKVMENFQRLVNDFETLAIKANALEKHISDLEQSQAEIMRLLRQLNLSVGSMQLCRPMNTIQYLNPISPEQIRSDAT